MGLFHYRICFLFEVGAVIVMMNAADNINQIRKKENKNNHSKKKK
jgi:hypothetical protein